MCHKGLVFKHCGGHKFHCIAFRENDDAVTVPHAIAVARDNGCNFIIYRQLRYIRHPNGNDIFVNRYQVVAFITWDGLKGLWWYSTGEP